MPLIKSLKPKAISKNIETEMHAGKPQKQAIAIAYNVKKAYGGNVSDNKMIDSLMAKRKKKLEASEDYNTSPDLREQSSSLSNSTLFDDLSGSEMGRPDAEEAMYADGGDVSPLQSAQDSMRKAFKYAEGGVAESSKKIGYGQGLSEKQQDEIKQSHNESTTYAKGGSVRIPQARSYVQYGDEMHDQDGNDLSHHDSVPASDKPESSLYKPKMIGDRGRQTIDLNMYANGGMAKIAYGHGKSELEDGEQDRLPDEDSSIAMADGGVAYNANLKENDQDDTALEPDENSSIAMSSGGEVISRDLNHAKSISKPKSSDTTPYGKDNDEGDIAYTKTQENDQKDLKQGHDESAYAEGGSVDEERHLNPDMEDTEESKDEASSIAMAEGGSVDRERHLAPDDVDTEESKDEASSIAMAEGGIAYNKDMSELEQDDTALEPDENSRIAMSDGGEVSRAPKSRIKVSDEDNQEPPHNPKSHEDEDARDTKARRRKLMIESLND